MRKRTTCEADRVSNNRTIPGEAGGTPESITLRGDAGRILKCIFKKCFRPFREDSSKMGYKNRMFSF